MRQLRTTRRTPMDGHGPDLNPHSTLLQGAGAGVRIAYRLGGGAIVVAQALDTHEVAQTAKRPRYTTVAVLETLEEIQAARVAVRNELIIAVHHHAAGAGAGERVHAVLDGDAVGRPRGAFDGGDLHQARLVLRDDAQQVPVQAGRGIAHGDGHVVVLVLVGREEHVAVPQLPDGGRQHHGRVTGEGL